MAAPHYLRVPTKDDRNHANQMRSPPVFRRAMASLPFEQVRAAFAALPGLRDVSVAADAVEFHGRVRGL